MRPKGPGSDDPLEPGDQDDDVATASSLDAVGEVIGKTNNGEKYDIQARGDALILTPVDGHGKDIVTTPDALYQDHQAGELYFPELTGDDFRMALNQLRRWGDDGD